MSLVKVQEVREYLNLEDDTEETALEELVNGVSKFVKNFIHKDIEQTTYTDKKFNGDGSDKLFLPQEALPIISITSLYDDTERAFAVDTLIASTDYVLFADEGYIQLVEGVRFNVGIQNIKTTYVGGYVTVPEDLQLACMMMIASVFEQGRTAINSPDLLNIAIRQITMENKMVKEILRSYQTFKV